MRKRKLNSAPLSDEERDAVIPMHKRPEGDEELGGIVGLAKGSALDDIREKVRRGAVSVEMSPDQVEDEIGSDRLGEGWKHDEEFARLKANIEKRGQTQAIRVRPVDPEWKPGRNPTIIDESSRFFLLSGRRRLQACRELGQQVLAFIVTGESAISSMLDDADIGTSDLEERFSENTIRKALTPLEELLSIGQIAIRLKHEDDASQEEIAGRLGVKQSKVSLGVKCYKHRDTALEWFPADAPLGTIRELVPYLGKVATLDEAKILLVEARAKGRAGEAKMVAPTAHKLPGGGSLEMKRGRKTVSMKVDKLVIEPSRRDDFERDLLSLIGSYQAR